MKILFIGVNGYIGMCLLFVLLEGGYEVVCCVRDKNRIFLDFEIKKRVIFFEVDFLKEFNFEGFLKDIDMVYYFIYLMSVFIIDFGFFEVKVVNNFNIYMVNILVK